MTVSLCSFNHRLQKAPLGWGPHSSEPGMKSRGSYSQLSTDSKFTCDKRWDWFRVLGLWGHTRILHKAGAPASQALTSQSLRLWDLMDPEVLQFQATHRCCWPGAHSSRAPLHQGPEVPMTSGGVWTWALFLSSLRLRHGCPFTSCFMLSLGFNCNQT